MIPELIDNRQYTLKDAVNALLTKSIFSKMAVGYFYLSGFEAIKHNLHKVKNLKILIGNSTNQETLDQLVEGFIRLDLAQKFKQTTMDYQDRDTVSEILDETVRANVEQLECIPQTDENEHAIHSLVQCIEEGRVSIKVYTKGKLHSKAYLFEYEDQTVDRGIAIVGSSNLSFSGISHNSEMNVLVKGQHNFEELNEWFDQLWEEAVGFDETLLDVIRHSWVKHQATPYEIYLKTLYHLVKHRIEYSKTITILDEMHLPPLLDFQRQAFEQAIHILEKYQGVFISDVVGVGKSYIASALIKYYKETYGLRTLIICPAALMKMWGGDAKTEGYNEKFDLGAKVLSMGQLTYPLDKHGNLNEQYSLLDEPELARFDLVMIDESHNFRNNLTQRYKILAPYLFGKKVVLVTATPQNKSIWDIYHQLKLFNPYEKVPVPVTPNELRTYFHQCEQQPVKVYDLLHHFLIRRKRRDIQHSQAYNPELYGQQLSFPQRRLTTIDYSIEASHETGIYNKILGFLGDKKYAEYTDGIRLTYARYGLYHALLPKARHKKQYEGISRAGDRLTGLMKVLLFKRFESSAAAFYETVKDMRDSHKGFLRLLREGVVTVGRESTAELRHFADDLTDQELFDDIALLNQRFDPHDFDCEKLTRKIEHDIEVFGRLLEIIQPVLYHEAKDDKLQQLLRLLAQHPNEKILIFTEYTDTAMYLHQHVVQALPQRRVESIFSERGSVFNVINRFAPEANDYTLRLDEQEIEVLISTDILSEGQNLQDCSIIINYDIHWNPVRLIQRIGRVDRIGSRAEEIRVYNFLPERELEKNLGLKERVHKRIQDIQDILGLDNKVLSEEEIVNETISYDIDQRRAARIYQEDESILDEDVEEVETGVEKAEKIILELRKNDPELFEKIKALPNGIRSAKHHEEGQGIFVFCESGDFQKLYLVEPTGKIRTTEIHEVLKYIECAPQTPSCRLLGNHNQILSTIGNDFTREVRIYHTEKEEKRHLAGIQKYIRSQLRAYHRQVEDLKERERIDILERVFTSELPHFVINALHTVRRDKLKGAALVKKLIEFYNAFNLSQHIEQLRENRKNRENLRIKLICSESFV